MILQSAGDRFYLCSDYSRVSKRETRNTFFIKSIGDNNNEADETFTITYSADYASTPITTAKGTILSDDLRAFVISDAVISEGDGENNTMKFKVTLSSGTTNETEMVKFRTISNSAEAGLDFISPNISENTLTFTPNEESAKLQEIPIQIVGDTLYETEETFFVELYDHNQRQTVLLKSRAEGTITNDDHRPTISFVDPNPNTEEVIDIAVNEGDTGNTEIIFDVNLSAVSGIDETLKYHTGEKTGSNFESATSNKDFIAVPADNEGTLTIPAGSATGSITINTIGDDEFEEDEHFLLYISVESGAIITGPTFATAVIKNDDIDIPRVSISVGESNSANIDEGQKIEAMLRTGSTIPTAVKPD